MRFIYAVLLIFIAFSSCRKKCYDASNPECENYNSCFGKKPPSANFTMQQTIPGGVYTNPEFTPEFGDTIWGQAAEFNALEEGATFIWKIGTDIREFKSKKFQLNFEEYLKDSSKWDRPIPIRLTVIKKPGDCFNPEDTLYKQTRNLVFTRETMWLGKFKGYFSTDPSEEKIIQIIRNGWEGAQWELSGPLFVNFPHDDSIKVLRDFTENGNKTLQSYKQWKWDAMEAKTFIDYNVTDGMLYYHSTAKYSPDGRHYLNITYKYYKSQSSPVETITFTGRKEL